MGDLKLETLGQKFVSKDGIVDQKAFKDCTFIGLYFSAHWCPSCRNFTPLLADFYKNANKEKKEIEIIYSSMDNDEPQFKEYYSTMPWLAFPHGEKVNEDLVEEYNVQGIPFLMIFDKNGKLIDKGARNTVQQKNMKSLEEWKAKL